MFNDIIDNYTNLNESFIFDEKDLYYKFDDWKKQKGNNILLVTGISGSGKSTLGDNLAAQHKAQSIRLDDFENCNIQFDKFTSGYYKLNPKVLASCRMDWESYTPEIYNSLIKKYYKYLTEQMEKEPNKLFIIEGLQLYDCINHTELLRRPMVIKGTGVLKATVRRLKRDHKGMQILTSLLNEIKHQHYSPIRAAINDEKNLLMPLRKSARQNQSI